jgi:DUF4097 and DUF4098 domain-containing protein YvlB
MSALAVTARADDWEKTYTLSGRGELRLDAKDGNVQLSSWDRNEIHAHVVTEGWRIGPDAVRISEMQSGNSVAINIHVPNGFCIGWCHRSLRIDLEVPRQAKLELKTGDGNIDGAGVGGELYLTTGDGNITLNSLDGSLQADTGDGNVRVEGRFDQLRIHTGDGNVEAGARAGSKLAEGWTVRTGDGNVSFRVPQDFSADVDLQTGDGRITLDVPVTVSGSLGRTHISGKLNQGGPLLEVHTGDGSIHLERE